MKKRVLSGIQPTGNLHFGRYFGAVKNWVTMQDEYEAVYCVVDYHAMTMPFVPAKLRANSWELATNLLAVGIKPENLFIQSLVPEHTELGWIMNCFASYGQLTRMTQFKDKSAQTQEKTGESFISAGLFDYPVLQAADILIYKADYVPVGKDQEQHLEFTRNIAQRFNNQVGKEYFVLPEPLYTEIPKVMSTADPTRKMSASLGEKHNIDVFADEKRIRKQVRSAVTDTGETPEGEMSPGVENLFSLLRAAEKQDVHDSLMGDYNSGNLRYVDLKDAVGDALVELSTGFRERKAELNADKKAVKNLVKASSAEIRKRAQQTVKEVKELIGLLNVRF
ncbi:tryptophan--tRNA ligase [Flavilitoribacter nigricans]|uniref:Tryptophan--tRNA ligase n=1 Tax=Flavilitoribacter nigricans (strain ATCC 23147 / DSM 23189 / NBRC 102662 / NCIMB 1420 / SS-2) TaxID=1122177 RepID=A0A2D0NIQ7_FLAN2|nr:tryptophan--tRNA ligase [Flavilitoribacter nigricans]PHN08246.1 tryptophan--tRNA ligase [Flavilitoribacter nigricans DSM 23189 = NBRC 102662]